ncbi:MAG TPA: hypothetical protein VJO35_09105 [Terriglobales bacterium]|nr:hypothetical protein [Terriglobales bacterium]
MKKTLLLLAATALVALSLSVPTFADNWPDPGPGGHFATASMAR